MGTSTQTLAHFGQIIRDARGLKPFDYGTEKNLKLYGDVKPPLYDLSKVTLPTAMYYSRGDFIVNHKVCICYETEFIVRYRNYA